MTLQEQIVDAWRLASKDPLTDNDIAQGTALTVGVLCGAGFPHAAIFVLELGQNRIGKDHPEMVEIRRKLGLP